MGKNRHMRNRKSNFIMIGKDMLFGCPEWKSLGPAAKVLYITLKGKYNGSNNGYIKLHYTELRDIKGLMSSSTISKAFKELEEGGWIRRYITGGIYRRNVSYELTEKYDTYFPSERNRMAISKNTSINEALEPLPTIQNSKNVRSSTGYDRQN